MKISKMFSIGALLAGIALLSCEPNEDAYPLPYDNRATGSFLRVVKITSFSWDFDDLNNSAFEAIYESVDKNFGEDLDKVEFYATHRTAAGLITDEVLVKTVLAADMNLEKVPEPTYSDYLRSEPIRVTYQETLTALSTLTSDPDGTTCSNIFPDVCPAIAFSGSLAVGDRVIFRVKIYDKQGRGFTVNNPQQTVSPSLGNGNEANITANLTGGIFYSSPMLYTQLIQRVTTTGNVNSYTGDYRMTQVGRWAPDFQGTADGLTILRSFPQPWMRPFVFGNSETDSTQTVTLSKVTGGLPSLRQFTCKYRGETISMMINLEQVVLGGTALSAGALASINALPTASGLGFPATSTAANLGQVFSPLLNTGTSCTSERGFFIMTGAAFNPSNSAGGGSFLGDSGMPKGIPKREFPNRGYYRTDRDGLAPGDVFSLSVDDDTDEYGRRNGYCNWYTRIYLTLTKI